MNIISYNNFEFTGNLLFNPEKVRINSTKNGGEVLTINFIIKSGSNNHFVKITGFKPGDSNQSINVFYKDNTKEKVPFIDRMTVDEGNLSFQHPSLHLNDTDMKFISNYDFANAVKNMFSSEKHKNKFFKIKGKINYNTYPKDGEMKMFTEYNVEHIAEISVDSPTFSIANIKMLLGNEPLSKVDNMAILTGYVVNKSKDKTSNNQIGFNGFKTQVEIPLNDQPDEAFNFLKNKYYGDDEDMTQIGLKVSVLNGAEDIDFTEDMLTEEERKAIDLGIDTFEGIKSSKGKGKGKIKKAYVRLSDLRGFKNPVSTGVNIKDLNWQTFDAGETLTDEDLPF